MDRRELAFAAALVLAVGLVTSGVAMVSTAGALVVAGVCVGLVAWLVLSE